MYLSALHPIGETQRIPTDIRVFKLRILNNGKQAWMLPLTKLIRTVSGGFRREKMVQTSPSDATVSRPFING